MICIGVDSDLSGGIAAVDFGRDEPHIVRLNFMPVINLDKGRRLDNRSLFSLLEILRDMGAEKIAIERALVLQQKSSNGPAMTAGIGTTHQTYGGIHALADITIENVYPAWPSSWKAKMKVTKDKERAMQLATELHPSHAQIFAVKKNHGLAEAVLLAHWCHKHCT